jgi:predicted outer membrane repeat protein
MNFCRLGYYSFVAFAITSVCDASTITVGTGGKYDYTTIQEAVWAANNYDEIIVAPGVYTSNWNNVIVDTQGKSIWLHSSLGPELTILDGLNWARGIRCSMRETAETHIEGFTIRNCVADGGGGMFLSHSSPTISNCIFDGNSSQQSYYYSASGGAILNDSSSPSIVDCTFQSNYSEYNGGAIYNKNFSSPSMTNCVFDGNVALKGGAICNSSSSSTEATGCTFQNNIALYYGGAVYLLEYCSITMSSCVFSYNSAQFNGGGVYNLSGTLVLDDCTFNQNYSIDNGGGGIALYSGDATINGSEFKNNIAPLGGGIYVGTSDSSLDVGTTFFCGNSVGHVSGDWNDLGGNEFFSSCDQGACCTNDTCVLIDQAMCIYVAGEYQGLGTLCTNDTCPTECLGDLTGDGVVDVTDVLSIIGAWGACP